MCPHYLKNILPPEADRLPEARIAAYGLTSQIKVSGAAAEIPDGKLGSVLHNPEVTAAGKTGAQTRVLIEQHQVPDGEPGRQIEIRAQAGGERFHEVSEHALGKWIIAARCVESAIGSGPDAAADEGNGAHVGLRVGRPTPEDIRNAEVEGLHQAIRRGRRKKACVIENVMDVRLRNAAQAGQPPLSQFTALDAYTGDIDQMLLQVTEIHLRLIREYILPD